MAWFFAGSLLLTFVAALSLRRPRDPFGAILALAAAGAALVVGFSVYPDWLPPAAFAAAAIVALPTSGAVPARRRRLVGAATLLIGAAFLLFALLGPADGLF